MSVIDVQLYGLLRDLAGEAKVEVEGENVGEILDTLVNRLGSRFKEELFSEEKIKSRYLLLLNGRRVGKAETKQTRVSPGDRLLVFAPIAGG